MFANNPLLGYHALLSATRSSGYPNIQLFEPHPYEMSLMAMRQGVRPVGMFNSQNSRMQYQLPQRSPVNPGAMVPQGMFPSTRIPPRPNNQRPLRDIMSYIP